MKKAVKVAAGVFYILLLCYIVFFARRRESMQRNADREELVNVVPLRHQWRTFKSLDPKDPRDEKHYLINLVGNVVLFIPFPFLLFSFGYKHEKRIPLIALFVSVFIEVVQYLFVIGVADIDDVILNVTGACMGFLLLKSLPTSFKTALVRA